jgi:hypothetical protein
MMQGTHRDLMTCVCVEANRVRVSQFDLKTGGTVTVGGACGTIVEIAWSQR